MGDTLVYPTPQQISARSFVLIGSESSEKVDEARKTYDSDEELFLGASKDMFTAEDYDTLRILNELPVIDKSVSKWHPHPLVNYSAARAARKEKEANTRRSTLNQIEFDKAIRKLLKKRHSIHNEANKPLSTPVLTEICQAILKTLLENNTLSVNTVQQMHTTPAPGVPYDDRNRVPPSTQMLMALPSNDPAPIGGSSDDDPNDIENPRDEPSSSTEASPEHPLDITGSSNGASLPVREDGSERREPPVPHGNRDLEAMHNSAIPKEVLLMFALQVTQILFTESRDINLLSHEAKILQYCAEAITGIGFFCGFGVILLRNRRNLRAATKIMSAIGYFSTGLGFIATMCVRLPNESMFPILGCIGFPFSAVFAYLLWKGWIV